MREEFALTLEDIVFRRTMIGFDPDQGRPQYNAIAAIAAAEAAVGLALIISVYRNRNTVNLDELDTLRG